MDDLKTDESDEINDEFDTSETTHGNNNDTAGSNGDSTVTDQPENKGSLLGFLKQGTENKSPTPQSPDMSSVPNGENKNASGKTDNGKDSEFPGAEPIKTDDIDAPDPDVRKMRYQSLVKNFTRVFNSMLAPGLELAYENSLFTQEEKNDLRMIRRAFKSSKYRETTIGTDYENYLMDQYEKLDDYESKLSKEEVDELIQSWNDWVGTWEKTMTPAQSFWLTFGGITLAHGGPIMMQMVFKWLNVGRFDGDRTFSFKVVEPPKTETTANAGATNE